MRVLILGIAGLAQIHIGAALTRITRTGNFAHGASIANNIVNRLDDGWFGGPTLLGWLQGGFRVGRFVMPKSMRSVPAGRPTLGTQVIGWTHGTFLRE